MEGRANEFSNYSPIIKQAIRLNPTCLPDSSEQLCKYCNNCNCEHFYNNSKYRQLPYRHQQWYLITNAHMSIFRIPASILRSGRRKDEGGTGEQRNMIIQAIHTILQMLWVRFGHALWHMAITRMSAETHVYNTTDAGGRPWKHQLHPPRLARLCRLHAATPDALLI